MARIETIEAVTEMNLRVKVIKNRIEQVKSRIDFSLVNWVDTDDGREYTDLMRELSGLEWG